MNLFFTHSSFPCLTHSSRSYNRDAPGSARNMLHLGALSVPSRIGGGRNTRTYLSLTRWFVIFSCTFVVTFKPYHHLTSPLLLLPSWLNFHQIGSVNGNPSGSLLVNRSKKAYLEEWKYTGDDSSDEQGFANFPALVQSTSNKGYIRDGAPPAPGPAVQPDSLSLKTYWASGKGILLGKN